MTPPRRQTGKVQSPASFGNSETGAVAVEFAFVIAPFLLLLTGLIELGLMLHTEASLQNATDAAGRLIRTGQATNRTGAILMTSGTFIDNICSEVTTIPDCANTISIDVRTSSGFNSLGTAMPDPITVGPDQPGGAPMVNYQPGGASKPTSVIVTYDWGFRLPIMRPLGNVFSGSARRLQAITIFRTEPF